MFQPNDLQLHSLDWASSRSGFTQKKRQVQVVENSSDQVATLRRSVPAGMSANKQAVVNRLIHLYAQGELG